MNRPVRRDPIERYLRRLSWWAPRHSRAGLVLEVRRHLYEATIREQCRGLSLPEAQRAARRACGPAWRIGLAERGIAIPSISVLLPLRRLGRLPRRAVCRLGRALWRGRRRYVSVLAAHERRSE